MGSDEEVIVADLEAGIGTLTRLAQNNVDTVLIVVEPTPKSLEVGSRAAALAAERSVGRVLVVANRIRNDEDLATVTAVFPGMTVVRVPDDPAVVQADRLGLAPLDTDPDAPAVRAVVALAEGLVAAAV